MTILAFTEDYERVLLCFWWYKWSVDTEGSDEGGKMELFSARRVEGTLGGECYVFVAEAGDSIRRAWLKAASEFAHIMST